MGRGYESAACSMGLDDTSTVSRWFSIYKTMMFAQMIVKMMIYVCLFLDVGSCKARYLGMCYLKSRALSRAPNSSYTGCLPS